MTKLLVQASQAVQAPSKTSPSKAQTSTTIIRKHYPNYKVIVLNDDFNSFEHVSDCLLKYIPAMTEELAWELTNQVHHEGLAIVWTGQQEQAELYHAQLKQAGLTMAPLEEA
jgi:ATP-dependent Clp protease adaptor protein ClpS